LKAPAYAGWGDNFVLTSARTAPDRRRLNPKKLLHSKWTATMPRRKEKHFIVTKVIQPEEPETAIELIELEAVYSRRSRILPWREFTNCSQWLQGWQ